jgi:hypothetical protein
MCSRRTVQRGAAAFGGGGLLFSAWEESGGVAIAGALCFFDLCCTRYPSQFMSFSEGAVGVFAFLTCSTSLTGCYIFGGLFTVL